MNAKPCDHCGTKYHAPYEDGLVECIRNLEEQRDDARDEVERLRGVARAAGEELSTAGQRWIVEQQKAIRLARFEAFSEAIEMCGACSSDEVRVRIEELRSAARPRTTPAQPSGDAK